MDGEPEPEREVTRLPTDADLVSLARELNRLGVAYVVIGGFAINRLGLVRATEDIDPTSRLGPTRGKSSAATFSATHATAARSKR